MDRKYRDEEKQVHHYERLRALYARQQRIGERAALDLAHAPDGSMATLTRELAKPADPGLRFALTIFDAALGVVGEAEDAMAEAGGYPGPGSYGGFIVIGEDHDQRVDWDAFRDALLASVAANLDGDAQLIETSLGEWWMKPLRGEESA